MKKKLAKFICKILGVSLVEPERQIERVVFRDQLLPYQLVKKYINVHVEDIQSMSAEFFERELISSIKEGLDKMIRNPDSDLIRITRTRDFQSGEFSFTGEIRVAKWPNS